MSNSVQSTTVSSTPSEVSPVKEQTTFTVPKPTGYVCPYTKGVIIRPVEFLPEDKVFELNVDGYLIDIPVRIARMFGAFDDMLVSMGVPEERLVQLDIMVETMVDMVRYCDLYNNNPYPVPSAPTGSKKAKVVLFNDQVIPEWEMSFFSEMHDFFLLAFPNQSTRFLCDPATKASARYLIFSTRSMTPQGIRERFNIVNDFGPGEEEAAWEACRWKDE
jgi:hypothetical protein